MHSTRIFVAELKIYIQLFKSVKCLSCNTYVFKLKIIIWVTVRCQFKKHTYFRNILYSEQRLEYVGFHFNLNDKAFSSNQNTSKDWFSILRTVFLFSPLERKNRIKYRSNFLKNLNYFDKISKEFSISRFNILKIIISYLDELLCICMPIMRALLGIIFRILWEICISDLQALTLAAY